MLVETRAFQMTLLSLRNLESEEKQQLEIENEKWLLQMEQDLKNAKFDEIDEVRGHKFGLILQVS